MLEGAYDCHACGCMGRRRRCGHRGLAQGQLTSSKVPGLAAAQVSTAAPQG